MSSSRALLLVWALFAAGCTGMACTRNSDCPKALTCGDIGQCVTPPPPAQSCDADAGTCDGDGGSGDGTSAEDALKKLLGL
jgi:hypothetical protein